MSILQKRQKVGTEKCSLGVPNMNRIKVVTFFCFHHFYFFYPFLLLFLLIYLFTYLFIIFSLFPKKNHIYTRHT